MMESLNEELAKEEDMASLSVVPCMVSPLTNPRASVILFPGLVLLVVRGVVPCGVTTRGDHTRCTHWRHSPYRRPH